MTKIETHTATSNKRRSTHFDESIENTVSFLASPHAINVMGESAVQRYEGIVQRLRLPNFTNDRIDITHFNEGDIPFIPLLENDDFAMSERDMAPNQAQRQIMEAQFGKTTIKLLYSRLSDKPAGLELNFQHFEELNANIYAPARQFTLRRRIPWKYWVLTGMPLVVENDNARISQFAPVMIHELTHVSQHEATPIQRFEDRRKAIIKMELEAYRVQCLATKALHLMGRGDELNSIALARGYDNFAKKVNAITQKHVGNQAEFELTDAMIEEALEYDIVND